MIKNGRDTTGEVSLTMKEKHMVDTLFDCYLNTWNTPFKILHILQNQKQNHKHDIRPCDFIFGMAQC